MKLADMNADERRARRLEMFPQDVERERKGDLQQARLFPNATDPKLLQFIREQRDYTGFNFMDDFEWGSKKHWRPVTAVFDIKANSLKWINHRTAEQDQAYHRHMVEAARWAYEHCQGEWERYITNWYIFENKDDAMMFKLKFVL